jgi:hypothetical protein
MDQCFVMPKDYNDVWKEDARYLKSIILRLNKIPALREDVLQQIWLKLLEIDVIKKFEKVILKNQVRLVTSKVACQILGIERYQWAVQRFTSKKLGLFSPSPVNPEGAYIKDGDLFLLSDIEKLQGVFRKTSGFNPPKKWVPEQKHWRQYLRRAVENLHKNMCRDRTRHHKEQTLDSFSEFKRRPGNFNASEALENFLVDKESVGHIHYNIDVVRMTSDPLFLVMKQQRTLFMIERHCERELEDFQDKYFDWD